MNNDINRLFKINIILKYDEDILKVLILEYIK